MEKVDIDQKGINIWCSAEPGLVILLTDRSDESSKVCNKIIDEIIKYNFNGDAPKNRCFIIILDINSSNEICSGWLKDLDESPLCIEKVRRIIPDGIGGTLELEVLQPKWIEPTNNQKQYHLAETFDIIMNLCREWITNGHQTTPIIFDVGCKLKEL